MKAEGVNRKLARTGVIRIALFPVSGVASLVASGIILRDVGLSEFGVITLIMTLPLLIPFSDLGISAALVNAFASGNHERARRLARLAWFVLWLVAGSILTVIICIEVGIGWSHILGVSTGETSSWVWAAFCVVMVSAIPFGIGQRILTGLDRVVLATGLQIIFPIINLILVLLAYGLDAPQIYFISGVVSQLVCSAVVFGVSIKLAGLEFSSFFNRVRFDSSDVRALFSTAGPMFIVMIGLPIAFQSHRLLLSHWSTAAELGNYAVALALYMPAWSLVTAMGLNLWPYFARERGADGEGVVWPTLYRVVRIFAGLGVLFAVAFFIFAPVVTKLWSSVVVPPSLWAGLSMLLLVQTVQLPLGMFLTTTRLLLFQALCVVMMAAGTILLTGMLVGKLGALAPILSSAFAVLTLQVIPGFILVVCSSRRAKSDRGLETPGRSIGASK